MKWEEEDIEDLIGKFIVGEASEDEIRALRDWSALSIENQKYLDDSLLIFENAQLEDNSDFDAEMAWDKVKKQISGRGSKTRFFMPVWGIAASLTLLFAFAFLFYQSYFKAEEFQFVSENQVLTQVLPDNTEISLNQNSNVEISYNERRRTGTIKMEGELLINIPKDKKVEWTIQAGEVLIQDIGTVFHVKAIQESETVEVFVQEGIVKFYSNTQSGITLQAGEKGIYSKTNQEFFKAEANSNVTAFKTHYFTFNGQELSTVVEDLKAAFGKEIILDGAIESCKLTVDFVNEDLETILSIIAETMALEITYEGDSIRISGDGCF
jgi:ferric-dicitrate binding protein FerR (iron transport regulator)